MEQVGSLHNVSRGSKRVGIVVSYRDWVLPRAKVGISGSQRAEGLLYAISKSNA
jgi:hypothetical protein